MRQAQSLRMTPQLTQSIRLLALSNLELDAFVESQIEANPLLARDEGTTGERDEPAFAAEAFEPGEAALTLDDGLAVDVRAIESAMGTRLDNVFPDAKADGGPIRAKASASLPSVSGAGTEDGDDIFTRLPQTRTLQDEIAEALGLSRLAGTTLAVARALAGFLDENGYLREGDGELAGLLGVSAASVAAGRAALQQAAPAGVGARTLRECLALQLAALDRLDPAMDALVHRLDLLARRDFAALAQATGLDHADLLDALEEIRALDPHPGRRSQTDGATVAPPDVIVREGPDGGWLVEVNPDTLPRVLVDRSYETQVDARACAQTRAFLGERLQEASWLVRTLDQRNRTLLAVTREIVRRQDGFLVHGVQALQPATLRQVADAIGMHESTVSRVTTAKTVLTPRGTFELKYFFTTALCDANGDSSHSAEAVRHRIRTLIEAETPTRVLSDDAIVTSLREAGIDIARRTVAKYREAMRIPSSVSRRREMKARALA